MASKKLSRDQKRKAKLVKRDKKTRAVEVFQPYAGSKYRSETWVPVVFATEAAIYDVILESNRTLTNSSVQKAITLLIEHLHRGGPALVSENELRVEYSPTTAVERLFYKIRLAWGEIVSTGRTLASTDLIGVLRTLLGSMEAQELRFGASRGYVWFLESFIPQIRQSSDLAGFETQEEADLESWLLSDTQEVAHDDDEANE